MVYQQLQRQAWQEWSGSAAVRGRYPTYPHYWRERYQRVYRFGCPVLRRSALSGWLSAFGGGVAPRVSSDG